MKKTKCFCSLSFKFPRPPNDTLSVYFRFDGTKEFLESDIESQTKEESVTLTCTQHLKLSNLRPACVCVWATCYFQNLHELPNSFNAAKQQKESPLQKAPP